MFLGLPPQLGQAAVPVKITGPGLATAAKGTRPTCRRPGQHVLQASRPVIARCPQRWRRRGEGRWRAADHLVAEQRGRELRRQVWREEERRGRLDRPETRRQTRCAGIIN